MGSRVKNGWIGLALGAVCIAMAASCSSAFHTCEDSRSCAPSPAEAGAPDTSGASGTAAGSAGKPDSSNGGAGGESGTTETGTGGTAAGAGPDSMGGEAGVSSEGGAGGAVEPPQGCQRDADCDDGLACNGSESCSKGTCLPGVAACAAANPDPTNCDAVCVESAAGAACVVQGQDKDHDGYLSKRCTQSSKPALDCDDAVATTHPGAAELCDGIDNNCNGLVDLSDGLTVSGTSVQLGTTTSTLRNAPAIAWATDSSVYGAAWVDTLGSGGDVWFETFDQAGTVKVAPKAINSVKTTSSIGLGFTFGGDAFGIAWYDNTPRTYFATITSAGVPKISPLIVGDSFQVLSQPQVARPAAANALWGVIWGTVGGGGSAPNEVLGASLTASGQFGFTQSDVILGSNAGIAGTATDYVVVADLAGSARGNTGLSYTGTPSIPLTGSRPVVGKGAAGFAIAVSVSGAAPKFYAYGATGALVCGPVSFSDASFVPAAITATPTGYLVASSGVVRVQALSASCVPGISFTVDPGPGATHVGIAGSASGYGMVWQDPTSGAPKRRVFGPRFCN